MEELTVAICVYNGTEYIIDTLRSLSNQTYKDFKLLILDDCSTDNTVEKIKKFLSNSNFPNSQIICHEVNKGLAEARKTIENLVTTEFLMFFDADDIAYPDIIKKMYKALTADQKLIAVGCYANYIDCEGKKVSGSMKIGPSSKSEFMDKAKRGKLIFMPPCSMFRLESAKRVGGRNVDGFPEGMPRYADMCEDCDLWTRMSDLYVEEYYLYVIPERLYGYRKHENAMSNDSYAMMLRMCHIKTNVRRRREGKDNLTFIDFLNILSMKEKKKLQREAKAGNAFRKAGLCSIKKSYFGAAKYLIKCFFIKPTYLCTKLLLMLRLTEEKK